MQVKACVSIPGMSHSIASTLHFSKGMGASYVNWIEWHCIIITDGMIHITDDEGTKAVILLFVRNL